MHRFVATVILLVLSCAAWIRADSPVDPQQARARDIFKQLIEIDTTDEHGATTPAAEAMARRLQDAGIPAADIHVLGPTPKKGNLVARLRGTGSGKPILLLAHLDVVEAKREDWSVDPFTFLEKDGFFYGRGTSDVKDGAAILVANMIRLAEAHAKPSRDLILALTADEEGGIANGVQWLLADHRDLIDAEFCVNLDGGDFAESKGRRVSGSIQAAEKLYSDFTLEATDPGGHSSLPRPGNPIYRLAAALSRVGHFAFPVHLNETTRAFLDQSAALAPASTAGDMRAAVNGEVAAIARLSTDPYYNALLRTTCVATLLTGGHAANALPQRARANVNCRIVPGETPEEVRAKLIEVVNDTGVSVTTAVQRAPSDASPLRADLVSAVDRAKAQVYPGLPIIPTMETGATDGRWLRTEGIPTYGISGVFLDMDDDRAHGRDERVGVKNFYDALEFNYELVRALAF
jgi:acetylornithine deacetylase/succinyl-diaminopimelate desuccinylase-like protein